MTIYRYLLAAAVTASMVLLTGCGEPALHGSDAELARVFESDQYKFFRLVEMAEHDKAQVLWLTSHELQPSDLQLTDQRWGEYDAASQGTGVRRLECTGNAIELEVSSDSGGFMHKGGVKGYIFSGKPLQPVVRSLDDDASPEQLRDGHGTVYRRLSSNWYLFFRQE